MSEHKIGEQEKMVLADGKQHMIKYVDDNGHWKDLGILNEDGCLPEERTGKYPVVKKVISLKLMDWVWWAGIQGESDINGAKLSIGVEALTEQEAIDAWNWRA